MFNSENRKRVSLLTWIMLLLGMLACRVEAPKIVWNETLTATPEIRVLTQVMTQVVTPTPLPTNTPKPTPTPIPSPTPTFDPLKAPIYYPLKDCVASRLYVADRAMVSLEGGPNGIRYGRDLHNDTIIEYAQPGDILEIVAGPWCSWGWIVWMVRTLDGDVGFTPEGNGNEYWLFPVRP